MNDYSEALIVLTLRLNQKFPDYTFGMALTPEYKLRVVMVHRIERGMEFYKDIQVECKDLWDVLFTHSDIFHCNPIDVEAEIHLLVYERVVSALGLV